MNYQNKPSKKNILYLLLVFQTIIFALAFALLEIGDLKQFAVAGVNATSRMINGLFSGVLTSMALLITLAANLYTPRLVKIFIKHPLIVLGLSFTVLLNATIILGALIPENHRFHNSVTIISLGISCVALAGTIPYLYYVSQFLRPSFFMVLLEKIVKKSILKAQNGINVEKNVYQAFDLLDVIINIGQTASKREDRRLIILVLHSYHNILMFINNLSLSDMNSWRNENGYFTPGTSLDARKFLEKEKSWPEAFILGRYVKLIKHLDHAQNEAIACICENLIESIKIPVKENKKTIIHMHLMVINSFMRMAIDSKDLGRFQLISYYYQLILLELAKKDLNLFYKNLKSYLIYGDLSKKSGLPMAKETIIYDLSKFALDLSLYDKALAYQCFREIISPEFIKEASQENHLGLVIHRSSVLLFWSLKSIGEIKLSSYIQETFLKDDSAHKKTLEYIYTQEDPLHFEFNDRLLRFSYMSEADKNESLKFFKSA